MLLCTKNQLDTILEAQRDFPVLRIINDRRYRAADTILSYRQLNEMGKSDLLDDDREDKKEWRRYSLKELLFTMVAAELKLFGLENERLKPVHKLFFANYEKAQGASVERTPADDAICSMLLDVRTTFFLSQNGHACFAIPPTTEAYRDQNGQGTFTVSLNNLLNEILEKVGVRRKVQSYSLVDVLVEGMEKEAGNLTDQEKKLLEIIRNDEYTQIKIEKKDRKKWIVRAGTKKETAKLKKMEIVNMITQRGYREIHLVQNDGRIVHVNIEDIYKMSQ